MVPASPARITGGDDLTAQPPSAPATRPVTGGSPARPRQPWAVAGLFAAAARLLGGLALAPGLSLVPALAGAGTGTGTGTGIATGTRRRAATGIRTRTTAGDGTATGGTTATGNGIALRERTAPSHPGRGPRDGAPRPLAGGHPVPHPVGRPARGNPLRAARLAYEQTRRAWDRPLTAYYVVLGSSLLITVLGLIMVFSASQIKALQNDLPSTYFFRKQLLAAAIGSVLLFLASRLPVRTHRALAYPLLLGATFLMCLVQVPGIGVAVNGNQNWISLGGPFQLQPSEFGKLALVLWGADLLARKSERNLLVQWKHLLVPLVPVTFMVLGLIMLGGDMGTAIILTAILFGLLWLAGAPTRMFVGVLGAAAAVGALLIQTNPNRMDRFACVAKMDPQHCWQAVHGIYALASGGWFGSGLGASVEKWGQLPEPHTDFIFAVTGEELGLAGTLSVLALFAALGYAGIRVAGRTEDTFVRFAAGGVTSWITVQAVVNIGAVLGLLPIAGVPLPLFSYGGSALLPTMFAIGLLICFARSEPAARAALTIRKPGVMTRTMRRFVKRRPSGER
jgi:cell division protein FtsW